MAVAKKDAPSVDKVFVSYEDVHGLIEKSATQLRSFKADIIIAIGGGGFVPARILREHTKTRVVGVVIEHYRDNNGERLESGPVKVQWLYQTCEKRIENARVLVVDEIDDSRETLVYVVEELAKLRPAAIGCFVLHNKKVTKKAVFKTQISYMAGTEVEDKWIVYPWESLDYATHDRLSRSQHGDAANS